MSFDLTQEIKILNPHADNDLLWGPYDSLALALEGVPYVIRKQGRTVGVIDGSGIVQEYWFREGIEDEDLVPKASDLSGYQLLSEKGQPNGYASLDSNGTIPTSELPDSLFSSMRYGGEYDGVTVAASASFPELDGQPLPDATLYEGLYLISTASYVNNGIPYQTGDWILSNGIIWTIIENTDAVRTVFGRTGDVVITPADLGFDNNNQVLITNNTGGLATAFYNQGVTNNSFAVRDSGGRIKASNASASNDVVTLGQANTNFIQNQTGQTQTAGFNISGTGTFGGDVTISKADPAITLNNTSSSIGGTISMFGDANLARFLFRPTVSNKASGFYLAPNGSGPYAGNVGSYLSFFGTDFGASTTNYQGMQLQAGSSAGTSGLNMISSGSGVVKPFNLMINGAVGFTLNTDRSSVFTTVNTAGILDPAMSVYSGSTLRYNLLNNGTAFWYIKDTTNTERGSISYSSPNSNVGIVFNNAANTSRNDIRTTSSGGIDICTSNAAAIPTPSLRIAADKQLVAFGLAGTGNRMVIADSNGALATQAIPTASTKQTINLTQADLLQDTNSIWYLPYNYTEDIVPVHILYNSKTLLGWQVDRTFTPARIYGFVDNSTATIKLTLV